MEELLIAKSSSYALNVESFLRGDIAACLVPNGRPFQTQSGTGYTQMKLVLDLASKLM